MSASKSKKASILIDLTGAVKAARENLATLFPEFSGMDVRLEEVETPLNAARWRLTFSAALPDKPEENSLADLLRPRRLRKVIELADNGQLVSVKAA